MKYQILSVLLMSFLMIVSCSEDSMEPIDPPEICPDEFLGEFLISEKSINQFPYDDSVEKVIFSDENGNEFEAVVINHARRSRVLSDFMKYVCLEDSTETFRYTYLYEDLNLSMNIVELGIQIQILIITIVESQSQFYYQQGFFDQENIRSYDYLYVTYVDGIPDGVAPGPTVTTTLVIDEKNAFSSTTMSDGDFIVNGETFSDVHTPNAFGSSNHKYALYYSETKGLIGIVANNGPLSLKFERME